MALKDYLGEQLLGVLAAYQGTEIVHHIGVVYPRGNNQLQIFIPKGHRLAVDSLVTLHLDNRTGVDDFDGNLRVYRTSYKGRVTSVEESWATITPIEFALIHGIQALESFSESGYTYPQDNRPQTPIPVSNLKIFPNVEAKDHPNKVGVLTTLAAGQPHTTVMAFLSSENDDMFLISMPNSFKSQVLKRTSRCFFTIDERAKFTFEQAIEWNYTIIEAHAHIVEKESPIYERIRSEFILKNPWEVGFFLSPEIEMFHLKKISMVYSGERH
jgi:nitroimidazol reductase NimA-like FMN-containing flavoprotein (pyridoxamine 5'-phosphate oxidase superfamily)